MFQPVNSRVNFPQVEENILKLWKDNNIFSRSIENRRGSPVFTFYEGPPTVNGQPGIHHVLARAFKDVILRYRTMKGCFVPRIAGWDTHGLPVELEVEKQLGLSSKPEIENYGVDRFNARCRESVYSYLKEWEAMTERIAFWVDLEHPYITMDNNYIETCWWAIKQMWDNGLVYQGYRVTPHCPRCGTSLSSHEVALGYQDDVEDPSVYIKFKIDKDSVSNSETGRKLLELVGDKPVYLLAWTTTPWTLPGNTALAVASDAEYSLVKVGDEFLILATARLQPVGLADCEVVADLQGNDLAADSGVDYEPLYNPHSYGIERHRFQKNSGLQLQKDNPDLKYRIIAGDFVSLDDGTGIVHIAPSYGEIDYEIGAENNLDFVHPVDLQGIINGNYPFSGRFTKEADPFILEDLEDRGLLFRSEKIRHTYPFCWRCDSPLLYYAKQTWYIRTTAVKDALITNNDEINWYPEYIKYGRFGDWLQNNVDWAFSRERYWGTPLPVWRCQSCGNYECIGSTVELANKPGMDTAAKSSLLDHQMDLHRPYVDDLTFDCARCDGKMERTKEVIDCWFDSGAMPLAQQHYPFENETIHEDGRFPADYICEAVDQTRGWFYSLHAISTLLFNQPSFRNVICLGHILDAKGEKMSKARGNVVEPEVVIDKFGADALRWYFYTSSPPGNVRRFSTDLIAETTRRFLLTLWNVYSFFITYANIDDYTPGSELSTSPQSELDRWIISELNQLIDDVDKAMDNYNPTEAGRKIEGFVDNLSNWYVRRSRRRFWKSENDADKLLAYGTLYQCLVTLIKLMAPLTPFIAEELYQNLVRSVSPDAVESIHLADFPQVHSSMIDEQLVMDTRLAMKVSSLGRAARSKAGIKVRQPLATCLIKLGAKNEVAVMERVKPQVLEELNVKDLDYIDDVADLDETKYTVNTEGDYSVAVPLDISPELLVEGMAREIVHRLQTMRRSADFDIADHIVTYYEGEEYIAHVMEDFAEYIKQETLSRQLVQGIGEQEIFTESFKLGGHNILLGVKRLT